MFFTYQCHSITCDVVFSPLQGNGASGILVRAFEGHHCGKVALVPSFLECSNSGRDGVEGSVSAGALCRPEHGDL
jgi:hypothetical protein